MSSSPWNGRLLPAVVVSWDGGYFQLTAGRSPADNGGGRMELHRFILTTNTFTMYTGWARWNMPSMASPPKC